MKRILLAFYIKFISYERNIPNLLACMFIIFILFILIGSNTKLLPYISTFLDAYGKYMRSFLVIISFLLLGLLFFPESIAMKETGEKALELLWIILSLPILAKVFNQSLAKKLIPWRKELGILMGMLALVHGLQYFVPGGLIQNITDTAFWGGNMSLPFFNVGLVALLISTTLLITSNLYSQKKLKKYWKYLHRIVYVLLILVLIHVALIKSLQMGGISWEEFIPLIIYFSLKIAEWRGMTFFKKTIPNI